MSVDRHDRGNWFLIYWGGYCIIFDFGLTDGWDFDCF